MKCFAFLMALFLCTGAPVRAQRALVALGSSTTAGLNANPVDSSWVRRVSAYYKNGLAVLDTVYNLGVSGYTVYRAMPTSYTPPASRPVPDTARNVTKANALLATRPAASGAVIVNFPTNGYDIYTTAEIMTALQTIYDSVTVGGRACYITTPQPRSDGAFATSAVKAKLAALKDSVINRFGVGRSLNFWDGMYNPADTTILPAYASGDNVHFNNAGHRELFNRVVARNVFGLTATPAVNDYRSNVNPGGLWNNPASWQRWNGTAWVTATNAPDSNSGTITVLAGDSINMTDPASLGKAVVEAGGILGLFTTAGAAAYTLADGPGYDLTVNGRLYVSAGDTLRGTGALYIAPGGQLVLRNNGTLKVSALNEGLVSVSNTGQVSGATLTNNGTLQLLNFTLVLNNATLLNNDSVAVLSGGDSYFSPTGGAPGIFINAAGAVLYKDSATGIAYVNNGATFLNNGRITGRGQYIFQTTTGNTGIVSPGSSPGRLTLNPGFVTGRAPVFRMEISTTGAVAGTNYDQVAFSTVNAINTSVTGASLQLTDAAVADSVGTVYTLFTSAGTLSGPFASVSAPSNFSPLTYGTNTITIRKIASTPLAVLFGDFTAKRTGAGVQLRWSTRTEEPGSIFTAERSVDGRTFGPVATVAGKGQAAVYEETDPNPSLVDAVYYRIRMDAPGGSRGYSAVVRLSGSRKGLHLAATPNPAGDVLEVTLTGGPADVTLTNAVGAVVRRWVLAEGIHRQDLSGLPAGLYVITGVGARGALAPVRLVKQ